MNVPGASRHSTYAADCLDNAGLIALGSTSGAVRVWDPRANTYTHDLHGHQGNVRALRLSRDGLVRLQGKQRGAIPVCIPLRIPLCIPVCLMRIISHQTARDAEEEPIPFLPCPQAMLSGGSDRTVRFWDLRKHQCTGVFSAHGDSVWGLTADDTLSEFVSWDRAGHVLWTETRTGETALLVRERGPVHALAIEVREWTSSRDSALSRRQGR